MNFKNLKRIALTSLLLPLFFSSSVSAGETIVKYKGAEYKITTNEKERTYAISPEVTEEKEREFLELALTRDLENKVEKENKTLEKKLLDFTFDNPSTMHFNFNDETITSLQNAKTFFPFSYPQVNIEAVKNGREIKLDIKTSSQDYIMSWYKDTSIIFLFPKKTQINQKTFGKIWELDTERKTKYGTYQIKEASMPDVRWVYSMLADAVIEKAVERVAKDSPYGKLAQIAFEVENRLAEQEKTRRETVLKTIKSGYKSFEFKPPIHLSPRFEIGRQFNLGIIKGYPEKFYVFINTNITLNPLTHQNIGTQTKKEAPLLKIITLKPSEIKSDTPAGEMINSAKELEKRIEEESKRGVSSKSDLERKYENLSRLETRIKTFDSFFTAYRNKKIYSSEFKKFREEERNAISGAKILSQSLAEYKKGKENELDYVKAYLKKRGIEDRDIFYIFKLNFDNDPEKEIAVFYRDRIGPVEDLSDKGDPYIINTILEKRRNDFTIKGEEKSLPFSNLLGVRHRDYNLDGKEEIIMKANEHFYKNAYEYFMIYYWDGEYRSGYGTVNPNMTNDTYFYNLLKTAYESDNKIMNDSQWEY
ncbi:hypothetical protein HZA33_02190, partial [Candidatus Pacearchaeota archaeon]|nr:hypothetical protein [Candidatus Pacearchaeota archaeon]